MMRDWLGMFSLGVGDLGMIWLWGVHDDSWYWQGKSIEAFLYRWDIKTGKDSLINY